jgi:multimeric flavodoxin WrbA
MKVLGLTCGRKMSNTEILVKEALMGAEEMGAEVEIVRLMDLNIRPCTGCNSCVIDLFEKAGSGECVVKNDDFKFIDDKILECDGLILGSPVYEKAPQGLLKILNDRMGPSHDLAFRIIAKKIREEKGITKGKGPDERSFKTRVASLFAVGGSDWTTLALPMLQIFALPMNMTVVDQHVFNWTALPAIVVLKPEMLERARRSGRHVAETLKKPIEEAKYIGDPGRCPICHSNVLELGKTTEPVTCAVCGVKGTLKTKGDDYEMEVTEEAKALSHVLLSGKFHHGDDMRDVSLKPYPRMAEIPALIEKYKSYLTYSKPDRVAKLSKRPS